jgi:hypothetical protein
MGSNGDQLQIAAGRGCGMSEGKPGTTLHIGVEYKFSLVARATNRRDGSDFAVYERRNGNGGAVDYIIARVPPYVSFHENPGNGLEGFKNREAAILTLGRWVTRPKPENRSKPVTCRMQRKKHFAPQMEMDLSLMQTKQQIESAAAERRQERCFGNRQQF